MDEQINLQLTKQEYQALESFAKDQNITIEQAAHLAFSESLQKRANKKTKTNNVKRF